jgi:hypothetical protein
VKWRLFVHSLFVHCLFTSMIRFPSLDDGPLVSVCSFTHFVTLIIISECMSLCFKFSFHLAGCMYRGEVAFISNKTYNITSDLARADYCLPVNIVTSVYIGNV